MGKTALTLLQTKNTTLENGSLIDLKQHPMAGGPQRQSKKGLPPPVPRRLDPPPPSGPTATANSSSSPSEQCRGTDELSITLVGTSGAGKSATGNSILGRREFVSKGSAVPVTMECQRGEVEWRGRRLVVVDTPGILPSKGPDEEVVAKKERCTEPSSSGAHVILLVLQAGRFTLEERESVQRIQRLFGEEALKFTVIVFTRKDDLEGETILNFVRKSEQKLRELVNRCGRRVCAFNNRATGADRERQVQELIEVIDKMLAGNGAGIKAWLKVRQLQKGVRGFKDSWTVAGIEGKSTPGN
ncbi:GTPase IMAP family member 9-like [Lissotriton helveticus]